MRPWRAHTKNLPPIERPWVPAQLDGEFLFGQKVREDRFWTDMAISYASVRVQETHMPT
jgi:hypothetical protein